MTRFAVCGDSGAGKTTMATTLARHLSGVVILECDRYHRWERNDPHWKYYTHLNPGAIELGLMNRDVQTLEEHKSIFRRGYDHATGRFTPDQEIKPADNIIACGLHTFICPEGLYDVSIFMDPDPVLKTQWKISRDIGKRGYTLQEVKKQIAKRQKDYVSFLQPLMLRADVIVNFCTETGIYTDSIKGIGRFLRVFIRETYQTSDILSKFDELDLDYSFSEASDRPEFWQIDIKQISSGYYYDYVVLCVLDIARQNEAS